MSVGTMSIEKLTEELKQYILERTSYYPHLNITEGVYINSSKLPEDPDGSQSFTITSNFQDSNVITVGITELGDFAVTIANRDAGLITKIFIDVEKKLAGLIGDSSDEIQTNQYWGEFVKQLLGINWNPLVNKNEENDTYIYPVTIKVWDNQIYEMGALVQLTLKTEFKAAPDLEVGIQYNGIIVDNKDPQILAVELWVNDQLTKYDLHAAACENKVKLIRVG